MVIELPADTTDAAAATDSPMSETDAEDLIGAICFKTGPPGTVGAELEWLVRDSSDPSLAVPLGRIREVLDYLEKPGALPGAGVKGALGATLETSVRAASAAARWRSPSTSIMLTRK